MEVPMSGCIMVPTASPQPRSVPMPTYEAPLVSAKFNFSIDILTHRHVHIDYTFRIVLLIEIK